MTNTTTTAPNPFFDSLLAGEGVYPFRHTFTGDYAPLGSISFRELQPDAAEKIVEAIREDAEALGLDPRAVVITALNPDGDAGLTGPAFLAHQEALDNLDLSQKAALGAAIAKISGALVSTVLGSWEAASPITPETASRLPASVQRQIVELAQARTLGEPGKNGSGLSPSA